MTEVQVAVEADSLRDYLVPRVAAAIRDPHFGFDDPRLDEVADLAARFAVAARGVWFTIDTRGGATLLDMVKAALIELAVIKGPRLRQPLAAEVKPARPLPVIPKSKLETHPGWIYYARIQGQIKIGWTSRTAPERMLDYPPGSELLAAHPGSRRAESEIQLSLSAHLTSGVEWFAETPEVVEYIERVVAKHGDPPEVPERPPGRKAPVRRPLDCPGRYRPSTVPVYGTFVLKERGWSNGMIVKFLGEPDLTEGHALHQQYGRGMKLWLKDRVDAAELLPEFEARWQQLVDRRLSRMEGEAS